MITNVVDFKKKYELVLNEEGSFCINQRMNNEAYTLEGLEDIKRFVTWNVIDFKFYHNYSV